MNFMMTKPPDGWEFKPIKEYINGAISVFNKENYSKNNFRYIDISSIDNIRKQITGVTVFKTEEAPSRAKYILKEGDLIVSTVRPNLNAISLVDGEYDGCICSSGFSVLRLNKHAYAPYFFRYLASPTFVNAVTKMVQGAMYPAVNDDDIKNFLIPIPPKYEDQSTIANELESKMAEVEKMRQAALRQKNASEAIHEAIFREIFPRHIEANIKKGWVSIRVKKVSQKIQYGITKAATTEKLGPKLLRITDIQNGSVNWDKVPYCDCEKNEYEKYLLEKDDILFVRTGATTGKSYLIKEPKKALFASYLIRVQCDNKIVNPRYLYSFFQSPFYWKLIGKGSRGGTLSGFNASMLSEMLIPIPRNLDEQLAIANKIEKKTEELNKTNQAIAIQLEAIQALPGAILREVFDFQEANA